MLVVEDVIAVIVGLSVLFFLVYAAGLLRMPTGRRPDTPTYDRYGDPLPESPNPGFQETEDERE